VLFIRGRKRYAFTLVEVLIVVAILGILAALIIPEYRNYTQKAKESAAKETLQIMRTAIVRYFVQYGVAPGYPGDNTDANPLEPSFYTPLIREHYVSDLPKNPFNGLSSVLMIKDGEPLPAEATSEYGWIYKAQTREFRIDWPGTDSQSESFYEY